MDAADLIVEKQNIASVQLVPSPLADVDPAEGQIKVTVNTLGLTSNNLSYAAAGEMLGYWNFFPAEDPAWGVVPAWGFATVTASRHSAIAVGEELFGYWPMGRHLLIEPHDITSISLSDRFEHRAELHPWYTRYYRVGADPATVDRLRHLQPVFWALHMTGWMLARECNDHGNFGVNHILVASASSKTAFSFAKSMEAAHGGCELVGLTSTANADFVERLGCYDRILTYDDIDLQSLTGSAAFVDMSGNASVVSAVHHGLGDRLIESIRVGATHLSSRGDTSALPGPERRFFFIPDVAEAHAATVGFDTHHEAFASAFTSFAAWADGFTTISERTGAEALRDAYLSALSGSHDPTLATIINL